MSNYPELRRTSTRGRPPATGGRSPFIESELQTYGTAEVIVVLRRDEPGVNVISAVPRQGYRAMDGSSMATPHVAGLAALLMQAVPTATAGQVEEAIFRSCVRPASMDADRANRGVPDGPRALEALQEIVR